MTSMKKITTYTALLVALLLAACSSDNESTSATEQPQQDELVTVGLRISAASGGDVTRASWQDNKAVDAEMMNLWTVVVVNDADNKVKAIHACRPTGTEKPEVDDYVKVPPGTYRFYSFANIAPSVVMQLLGVGGTGATGSTVTRGGNDNEPTNGNGNIPSNPTKSNDDNIDTKTDDTVYEIAFTDGATVSTTTADAVVARINGNGFDLTAADNGLGAKGIPMSNVQTKEIVSSTTFDLIVVRMMAKIELQLFNETGSAITVKSATLSNVTQNTNGNLKLLPTLTKHDEMAATHKDIQPNLGYPLQANYTYTPATAVTVPANYKYNDHKDAPAHKLEFYVNESATPTNAEGLFYLTLEIDNGGTSEYRYALISNDASEWNYIARNDYRIIPIVFDDMKFEVVPYDFPPIGVYPCSVKEVDAANQIYEFTFHDYGHFHLLPSVTKGGAQVDFSATTPTSGSDYKWTLIDNDFSKSFFTYDVFGGTADANPGSFYRTGSGSTDTDGDEEGQTPVWYPNTTGKPQWDPAASANYRPFIFGYIADPGSALTEDKKVYHEMKIQVYNGTTAYRQMLYRFYMTLDTEQMLYAPALHAAPRHTHILH